MSDLVKKIEEAIQSVIDGSRSQYVSCRNENDEMVVIRVSDHVTNPERRNKQDISLVLDIDREDQDQDAAYSSLHRSKKTFNSVPNQYFLDEEGNFVENFETIERMLSYHDIEY